MTEYNMPGPASVPPRRQAKPDAAEVAGFSARRQALVLGAGALGLAGIAAAGASVVFNGAPGESPPPLDNRPGLKLADPVLGSPPAGQPAPLESFSAPPSVEPSIGASPITESAGAGAPTPQATARSSEPSRSGHSVQGPRTRVLHDPSDEQMNVLPQEQQSQPEINQQAPSNPAPVQPVEAFKAPPAEPTMEASSPLAPNLVLRTTPAWHLARRAGIAVSAADVADIEAQGIAAWIDTQLTPEVIDDSHVEGVITQHFPWAVSKASKIATQTKETFRAGPQLTNALLNRARFTKRILLENVVETLANHVYLPTQGKVTSYAGEYDQVLRKHALGRYADLLYAVLTHAALLVELDNHVNTKDNPNENLGRELLELYTVGVGNYSEQDVRNSALLLTGHGIDWDQYAYRYVEGRHHTGAITVMGFSDANADPSAGPALLRRYVEYLTGHRGTARRLARRFAVRFIRDDPSEALVDDLAEVYLANDTNIKDLVKATLTHPEFETSVGLKWRRPGELIGSIARAAQVFDVTPQGRLGTGDEFNMGLYGWLVGTGKDLPRRWPVVNGYPDTADYWNSASIRLSMLNATQDAVLGDKKESGETSWSRALSISPGDNPIEVAKRITWHLTGYRWPDEPVGKIATLLMGHQEAAESSALPEKGLDYWVSQAVRVIFASPYASLR